MRLAAYDLNSMTTDELYDRLEEVSEHPEAYPLINALRERHAAALIDREEFRREAARWAGEAAALSEELQARARAAE